MTFVPEIKALIARQGENGGPFWSREDGNIHAPAGFSTIDVLHAIGLLGGTAQDYPAVQDAVTFLMTYQNDDHSFSYARRRSKLLCVTANILSVLGRLGVADSKRAQRACDWLLAKQGADGGWRCATVKPGKSPETDASNPGTTLWTLDACLFRDTSRAEKKALNRGALFLLDHWDSRAPLGPCTFGIGSRFLETEFPFRRYNLFYYVYVLSHYKPALADPRFHEAYQTLAAHAPDGQMHITAPHKAWIGSVFSPIEGPSKPATQLWNEIRERVAP